MRCSLFSACRKTLLENIIEIVGSISNLAESELISLLLYGDKSYSSDASTNILTKVYHFFLLNETGRFDIPLINENIAL